MIKAKMVLCFLLAAALILPLSFAAAPAVQADSEEPQEQAEAIVTVDGPPNVLGIYQMKGRLTGYDWEGNKSGPCTEAWLIISCQNGQWLDVSWFPSGLEAKPIMSLSPVKPQMGQMLPPEMGPQTVGCSWNNGYVGRMVLDTKGKVKNKPGLSSWFIATSDHVDTLNAKIKLDKNFPYAVKSMKVTVHGWGVFGQFEGKFTAKPYLGPTGENGLPPGVSLPDQSP